MKAPRTASPAAGRFRDLVAAVARIETRQAAYEQVAHRMLDILSVQDGKLEAILEAATREPGPGPVAEVLAAILSSLREQEGLLLDLPRTLAAVVRDELRRDLEEDVADDPDLEPTGMRRLANRSGERS